MNRSVSALTALAIVLTGSLAGCAEPVPDPVAVSSADLPAWAWQLPQCAGYQPARFRAQHHRRTAETVRDARAWRDVTELTEAYEVGWGPRAIEEIRTLVAACEHYEHGGYDDPSAFREQHRVVATDFAGDESLLVETVRLAPPEPMRTWYSAAVRRGDVIATVRAVGVSAAETRRLAQAAADRIS